MTNLHQAMTCWFIGATSVLACATPDDSDEDAEVQLPPTEAVAAMRCSAESECSGGLACVAGTCQPCSAHSQCESDVCDQGAATPLGPGACVPEEAVVYVDASTRPACFTGDGSRANPVCEIREAFPRAFGVKYAVRVYPGNYLQFAVVSRTVFVFGPGDGSAIVGTEDAGAGARVIDGARVVLDGLDFGVGVLNAVICQSSNLKVLRSTARGDNNGILATDCTLDIDRVRASGSSRAGLTVAGTGTYRVTNSYFTGGDLPSVVFSGSNTGVFMFNTVTGGGEIRPGTIDCGTSARVIRDSIAIDGFPAADGAQTVGACVHRRVVVGSGDARPDPGLIKIDPDLDAEGRLLDTPSNAACCIDRGARFVSSLYTDFFGTPRPQGVSNDVGAHELVQSAPAITRADDRGR
jgi:hypothetical protein